MSRRLGLWAPLGILLVAVAAAVLIERGGPIASDLTLYLERGSQALAGTLPYRDIAFEYPPLAILPMAAARLLWPFGDPGPALYAVLFAFLAGLLAVAIGWLLRMAADGARRVADDPAVSRRVARGAAATARLGAGATARFGAATRSFGATAPRFGAAATARFGAATRSFGAAGPGLDTGRAWLLLVLVGAPSMAFRFDIWPAALVLAAVVAAERGRPGWAGSALGAGMLLKLFPAVVLPVLLLRALALGDRRGALRMAGAFVLVVGVVFGATLLVAGPAALQWLTYFRDRGLQFESTGSGLLQLGHLLAGLPASATNAFGAIEIRAPGADLFVTVAPLLEAACALAAWAAAALRFRAEARATGTVSLRSVAAASVLAILALIVGSKVFSVQYVVWFLPLLPLVRGPAFRLGVVAMALTTLVHPFFYRELIEFAPAMTVALNVRNGVLLALFAWLAADLVRSRGLTRATSRVRPDRRRSLIAAAR